MLSQRTKKLDSYIRGAINKCLNTKGLPKDFFYTHYKEGGLNLMSFVERNKALQLRTFAGLLLAKDRTIKKLIQIFIINETKYRGIQVKDESPYFGTPLDNKGEIIQNNTSKINCLFCRAVKAMYNLNIKIHPDLDEENNANNIIISDINKNANNKEEEKNETDNTELVDERNIMKNINNLIRKRHANNLKKLQFKAHTFSAMDKSTDSNFFLANFKAPTSNNIIKFAILARCNNLPTNELLNKNSPNVDPICHRCSLKCNDSLMHRINGCNKIKNLTTKRHNAIVEEIIKGIRKCNTRNNNIIFNRNTKVIDRSHRTIVNLKPDIWFINNNKLTLIEINSPYGTMNDRNDGPKSSLQLRREEKINKYKEYIELCKNRLKIDVELYVIVISSLGIIPNETNKDLKKLFNGNKKVLHLVARRCVVATLRESMLIFYRIYEKSKNSLNQNHNVTPQDETPQSIEIEENPDYNIQYEVFEDNNNNIEEEEEEEEIPKIETNTQEELIEEISEELIEDLLNPPHIVVGEKAPTAKYRKEIRRKRSNQRTQNIRPNNNKKTRTLSRYLQFVLAAKKKEKETRNNTEVKKYTTKNRKRSKPKKAVKSNKTVAATVVADEQ